MSQPLILAADSAGLEQAVEIMRTGGVIAYPTETLYGLGGLATQRRVVERVLAIKGRGPADPLPLIVADEEAAAEAAHLPSVALELAEIFWPGPLTFILRARMDFPPGVILEDKIALRVSFHPLAQTLTQRLNAPLIATSANQTGQPGATTAEEAFLALAADPPDLILDGGPSPGGPASTILDMTQTPPLLVREGAIAVSELKEFLSGWA